MLQVFSLSVFTMVESWRVLHYIPYLWGCTARDPVPEILAWNILLVISLLLTSNKLQNMINQLQLMMSTRSKHYKNVCLCSCLKEAYPDFCSMRDQSIFLLLPRWNARPSQRYPFSNDPPPNIKFAGTHTFIHLGGDEGGIVTVIKSVLAKNTAQWLHVADDSQELNSKGFITIFSNVAEWLVLLVFTPQQNYLNWKIFLLDSSTRCLEFFSQLVSLSCEIQSPLRYHIKGCLPIVRMNRLGWPLNNGKGFSKINKPTKQDCAHHL